MLAVSEAVCTRTRSHAQLAARATAKRTEPRVARVGSSRAAVVDPAEDSGERNGEQADDDDDEQCLLQELYEARSDPLRAGEDDCVVPRCLIAVRLLLLAGRRRVARFATSQRRLPNAHGSGVRQHAILVIPPDRTCNFG